MNDKEKKAIEKIEKQILIGECEKAIGVPIYISDLKIVLNLIEKQKAEIENKDIALRECERNLIEERQNRIKKDKMIDLMANHIATSDSNLCQYLDMTTKCKYYAGENGKLCDNCIKQYFEKKSEEDK